MEYIEMQTSYHLTEVNLFYILVYDFFIEDFQVDQGKKLPQTKIKNQSKNQAEKAVSLLNAPL